MGQNQAAQLSPAHHPSDNQEAYDLPFIAAFLFAFFFLALVAFTAFPQYVSQHQAAQPGAAQHTATEQETSQNYATRFRNLLAESTVAERSIHVV